VRRVPQQQQQHQQHLEEEDSAPRQTAGGARASRRSSSVRYGGPSGTGRPASAPSLRKASATGAPSSSFAPSTKAKMQLQQQKEHQHQHQSGRRASVSGVIGHVPLHLQDARTRAAREEAAARHERSMMKECTFKPKVNPLSAMYRVNQVSLEQRIERLAKPSALVAREKEEKRKDLIEKELAECTFRPSINHRSHLMAADVPPITERLTLAASEKAAQRERMARIKQEEELKQYTFHPTLNPVSVQLADKGPDRRPIHERIGELQRQKDEKLHHLRMERAREENMTFHPQLDEVSVALAKSRRAAELDVTERLSRSAAAQVGSRHQAKEEARLAQEAEQTFHPSINPISERIVEESAMFVGENRDFLKRQKAYEQRKREMQLEAQRKAADTSTFEPKIGGVSEMLVTSHPGRANETFLQKLERLSYKDKQHTEEVRRSLQEEYYGQFSFKPKINKISAIIGQGHSHEELYRNDKNRKEKERAKAASDEAFKKEFTFRPKLSAASEEIASKTRAARLPIDDPEHIIAKIEEHKQQREAKLDEQRKAAELEELKKCTFRPTLQQTKVKQPEGPVLVPGLSRHLEIVAMARQKALDQKKREEEVFGLKRDKELQPYTIPEPFSLSADPQAHIKKARIKHEVMANELKECTFRPKTNVANDKEMIRNILREYNNSPKKQANKSH
jgi:hypothetical protein